MASVMTSTAREYVGFGHLDVWGLGGYNRHREQADKEYYNFPYYNHSLFFLQSTKMVAKAGSPRSSLSLPLHGEHLLQLGFSSPLCSVKNEILIGRALDANHIGSKLFQLQCQVLQKCSAMKESSTSLVETGLGPNNRSVENSDLNIEKQTPNATPLRKRVGKKRVPESPLIVPKQQNERDYALNGSVQFIDKYEHLKVVRLVEGMNISGAAYAKCLERASHTTDAKVNSVITILSRVGLNKDEIGLLFSKRPSLLKRDAVQLMKVFHLLLGLGCREEQLCGLCIQYPALLECDSGQIRKVVVFLQSVGLTKTEVLSVLHKRPRILSYSEDRVKLSVNCLLKMGVPKEDLCRILNKSPALFFPMIQKNLQIHLEFLVRIGLEPRALGKTIARRPSVLGFDLEGMALSYEYLLRLGVKPDDLGKVLLWRPQLLGYRITTLEAKIKYLRELGVKDEALGKVITRAPQVICLNYEEKLKPVVEFLQSVGLDQDKDIEMVLSRNGQILCCNIEKNLRPKFEFFYTVGLSKRQVARIAVLFPPMFGLSIEGSLKPKYNYLVDVMKHSVQEIVDFPQYFGCSLEKRIKPRYEELARRGIQVSLRSMLRCNDQDFESRYLHSNNHKLSANQNEEC